VTAFAPCWTRLALVGEVVDAGPKAPVLVALSTPRARNRTLPVAGIMVARDAPLNVPVAGPQVAPPSGERSTA